MKFSVLIPVYNVEAYLCRCLDSLKNQSYRDWECILIDDGSSDGSGIICDEYAHKDNRFRVIHKENGGVSSARNVGLDLAKGEWVIFVDADDWVSEDFFDVDDTSADIIERPYFVVDEKGKVLSQYCPSSRRTINNREEMFFFFVRERTNALWNKVFRLDLIRDVRFDESVSIGEDFLFYLETIKRVKSYEFSLKGAYFYMQRQGSAMSNIEADRRVRILFENMQHIKSILNLDEYDGLRTGIMCMSYFQFLCRSQNGMSKKSLADMKMWVSYMAYGNFKYVPLLLKVKVVVKNFMMKII